MLEVLITIVIVALGLLGIAGLQSRMQLAELEAYQRTQAIVILQEMVDRINANRKNAASYVTGSPRGTGNAVADCSSLTGANFDLCQWNTALLGAAETDPGSTNIGAMIGACGCITNPVATMPREVVVAVVWQGITPTAAPTTTNCGSGSYGNDATRRAMVTRIMIGCLQNAAGGQCCTMNPVTGVCEIPP